MSVAHLPERNDGRVGGGWHWLQDGMRCKERRREIASSNQWVKEKEKETRTESEVQPKKSENGFRREREKADLGQAGVPSKRELCEMLDELQGAGWVASGSKPFGRALPAKLLNMRRSVFDGDVKFNIGKDGLLWMSNSAADGFKPRTEWAGEEASASEAPSSAGIAGTVGSEDNDVHRMAPGEAEVKDTSGDDEWCMSAVAFSGLVYSEIDTINGLPSNVVAASPVTFRRRQRRGRPCRACYRHIHVSELLSLVLLFRTPILQPYLIIRGHKDEN
ncbi:hypothetical protein BDY19DRAFT_906660 [Irpex rosettiformis]|uniref:Uncharacterized protein n=1 Tax=Irpex rosettiformis TaxID=378272 RepID=A0ACB8U353_9APHY|nr:hypothetical protein BDY19DRAFT_906660 [Irpex rosettiformis]